MRNEYLYLKTVHFLEQEIKSGKYAPGDILPSDIELSRICGVSVATVRRAYQEFVNRGWIRRIKKKGTVLKDIFRNVPIKIGVITISDTPPFARILEGINSVLSTKGVPYIWLYNQDDIKENESVLQHCLSEGFTGLIVVPPDIHSSTTLRKLVSDGFPVVLLTRYGENFHCVCTDDYRCGYLIGEHFLKCGYRFPAAIYRDKPFGHERLEGFCEALAQGGLHLPRQRMFKVEFEEVQDLSHQHFCEREVEWLLSLEPRCDAVFVFNDHYAAGIYQHLLHRGLRVPRDIAVAGVDNLPQTMQPFPITTVDSGLEELGMRAAQLVLELHQNKPNFYVKEKITPTLVVRSSTLPTPAAALSY